MASVHIAVRLAYQVSSVFETLQKLQYDLLLKDVELLRGELGSLPAVDLDDEVEQAVLQARGMLRSDSITPVS